MTAGPPVTARPDSMLELMDLTDRECVEAVLNGDPDAYRDLVSRYSGTVFCAARRITGNDADAEEVVQDTFLRGYLQIGKFELRADFGTWIYRIGVNCSIDLLRKRKRQPAWAGDALYLPSTRESFQSLLGLGLTDALRAVTDAPGQYTFWDYQAGAWQKNQGLRIDHLLLSPQASDRLVDVGIDSYVRAWEKPSDHVPVWIDLDLETA